MNAPVSTTASLRRATAAPSVGAAVVAPPSADAPQVRAFADALSAQRGGKQGKAKLNDDDRGGATLASSPAMVREQVATAPAPQPSRPGDVDAATLAQLDRIAAAIAEVRTNGAQAQVTLALPPGAGRIEGAVLGRDAAGQLTVVLLPNAAVLPAVAAQWSGELRERLLRRDIRAARIAVRSADERVGASTATR